MTLLCKTPETKKFAEIFGEAKLKKKYFSVWHHVLIFI
jgi:hypothetical protein